MARATKIYSNDSIDSMNFISSSILFPSPRLSPQKALKKHTSMRRLKDLDSGIRMDWNVLPKYSLTDGASVKCP